MELIFLTGMSGAGKSAAVRYLEDIGFFCMDNVPPYVLPDLVNSFYKGRSGEGFGISKLAFVVDVRSSEFLDGFTDALAQIDEESGIPYKIIFLEASDSVLISRYRQTRRKHPFGGKLSLTDSIASERVKLLNIRGIATNIIDTSMMEAKDLWKVLGEIINADEMSEIVLFVESFGFKYGMPVDCDYVFDARFLPNPYYLDDLRNLTGCDAPVSDYLNGFGETGEFVAKITDILKFTVPYYIKEGKGTLHIGIGCTGGRHRSVYCTETVAQSLRNAGYSCIVNHRDIDKEAHRYKKADESNG